MAAEPIVTDDRIIAVVLRPHDLDPASETVETQAEGRFKKEQPLGLDRDMSAEVVEVAAGFEGAPHYHPNEGVPYENPTRSQFKYVLEGKLRIALYTHDGTESDTVDLEAGEGIQLLEGHQVQVLEDTVMLTVIAGPTADGERNTVTIEAAEEP